MGAEAAALVRSFRVGRRVVTITMPPTKRGEVRSTVIEWEPDVPPRLSKRELRQYRAGRNAALRELAEVIGGSILVIDV